MMFVFRHLEIPLQKDGQNMINTFNTSRKCSELKKTDMY